MPYFKGSPWSLGPGKTAEFNLSSWSLVYSCLVSLCLCGITFSIKLITLWRVTIRKSQNILIWDQRSAVGKDFEISWKSSVVSLRLWVSIMGSFQLRGQGVSHGKPVSRRSVAWVDQNIICTCLRPTRHGEVCERQCGKGHRFVRRELLILKRG